MEIQFTRELILNHKQNALSFKFTALNYLRPERNRYSYILEGFEETWSEPSHNRVATYTNIPHGEYVFKVKGANNDGVWNEKPAVLSIAILPPWWKTWWFRVSLAIFVIGGSLGFYIWRVSSLKARQRDLEQKVNERTAELQKANLELTEKNEEIQQQAEELQAQKDSLEEKNYEIEAQKDQISTAYKQIKVLSEFGQKLTATLNLDAINEMIYEYVGSLMDTDAFGIGVYNQEKKVIEYPAFMEKGKKVPPFFKPVDKKNSLTAWCFNHQEVVLINALSSEYKKYIDKPPDTSTSGNIQSLIHVPLLVEGRPIGIIAVNSFKKNAYGDNELANIKSLASYLSIALDNANVYRVVARQNEHIKSGIRYARTIQQSILPLEKNMDKYFGSFVLFRPKDVVSGDFYWFYPLDDTSCLVAVVDCTGHGVPGAFMSLIGNRILNDTVGNLKITEPGKILERLDAEVRKALKQDQTDNQDGMDVCMVKISRNNAKGATVVFAGAKRNLYVWRDGQVEPIEGDRRSIGGFFQARELNGFTNRQLKLAKGDQLYLSSDGYKDQNNPGRERVGTKKFLEWLGQVSAYEMGKQKTELEKKLDSHQGNEEQRDDITLMGVRI
jgi:serine phosphatase RsbU (regulator of sigma subunit)